MNKEKTIKIKIGILEKKNSKMMILLKNKRVEIQTRRNKKGSNNNKETVWNNLTKKRKQTAIK